MDNLVSKMFSVPACPSQVTLLCSGGPSWHRVTLQLNGGLPWLSSPDRKAIWQVKEHLNSTYRCFMGRQFQSHVTHVSSERKASSNRAGDHGLILRKVHHQSPTGLELELWGEKAFETLLLT